MSKSNVENFKDCTIYAGIDVHKNSHKVSVFLNEQFYTTVTMPATHENIIMYLKNNFPGAKYKTAYEAGFSGYGLHRALLKANIDNIVVHAADIPISHKHKEQKSDKVDAKLIAQNLVGGLLQSIFVPEEAQIAVRNVMRFRDQVVKDLNRSRCRIKSKLFYLDLKVPEQFNNSRWSRNFVKWLEELDCPNLLDRWALDGQIVSMKNLRQQLLDVNRKLRELSRTEEFAALYTLLTSVPGIGPVGAWRFITEIGDMRRFSSEKKLCSYVGLIPNSNSSGDKERKGRITTRGNKRLRTTLIEAAWTAVRNDPALAKFYHKKNLSKTNKNTAIVAVARKLLCKIRGVIMTGAFYEKGLK